MATPTVKLRVEIPVELNEKLEEYIQASGKTKTATVIEALEEYLCENYFNRKEVSKMTSNFFVWGSGPAQSELIRNAENSNAAAEAAQKHGFVFNNSDDWAVEVEATPEEIDKATRFDPAVVGYCEE